MKSGGVPQPAHQRTGSPWRQPLVWSAIALTVLALSGMVALVLNRSAESETRSSFRWATHTLQVEDELHAMIAALGDAESTQRGFLLSRDTMYLAPSIHAGDTARELLASLRRLTADNPSQQRRLDTLDRLADARLALLARGIALMRAGQRDSLDRLIRAGRGHAMMDSIHATVRDAVAEEHTLLERRQAAVEMALSHRRLAEELIVGIALLAMALAAVVWIRLRRAERVVTMCALSKAIQFDGEWMSIEAYMERRFGVSITHGISPAELQRLEAGLGSTPVLASATQGVTPRGT